MTEPDHTTDRPMTRVETEAMWGRVHKGERDCYRAALERIAQQQSLDDPLTLGRIQAIARKALGAHAYAAVQEEPMTEPDHPHADPGLIALCACGHPRSSHVGHTATEAPAGAEASFGGSACDLCWECPTFRPGVPMTEPDHPLTTGPAVRAALDAYWEERDRSQDNVRAMAKALEAFLTHAEGEKPCDRCGGKGRTVEELARGRDHLVRCGACGGTGKVPADRLVLEGPTRADERRKVVEFLRREGVVTDEGGPHWGYLLTGGGEAAEAVEREFGSER